MKAPKEFNEKRIHSVNLPEYLKKKYKAKEVKETSSKVLKITPLLQNDYGGDCDCTLTSITACINYHRKGQDTPEQIYNEVEKIAKKYFYRGNIGTMAFFIQKIYDESLKKFPCAKKKTYQGFFKGVAFNFNTINNSKKVTPKE